MPHEGWAHERVILLPLATTEADQDIIVYLSPANFNYGQAKSDGTDIRFYDLSVNSCLYRRFEWNVGGISPVVVRVPMAGTTELVMEYGNPDATDGQVAWSGQIVMPAMDAITRDGWAEATELADRYPRGAASSGATGGSEEHQHGVDEVLTNSVSATSSPAGETGSGIRAAHHHSLASSSTTPVNHEPLHARLRAYRYAAGKLPAALPNDMVALATAALSSGSLARLSEYDGRMLKIGAGVTTGGSDDAHAHTVGPGNTGPVIGTGATLMDKSFVGASASHFGHRHPFELLTSSSQGLTFPSRSYLAYRVTAPLGLMPHAAGMFLGALPPLGWTRLAASDGKHVKLAAAPGVDVEADTEHSHTFSGSTGGATDNYPQTTSGLAAYYYPPHTHTVSGSTGAEAPELPYYEMIMGELKDMIVGEVQVLVPPGPPVNVQVLRGIRRLTVSWDEPLDDGGTPITEYRIYRSLASGAEEYLDSVGAEVRSYLDDNPLLVDGTVYFYRISAVNVEGEGELSAEASASTYAKPGSPRNLAATHGNQSMLLNWDAPLSDGGQAVGDYAIYLGTVPGAPTLHGTTGSGSVREYLISSLTNGVTYYFAISAINAVGEGTRSGEVSEYPSTTPTAARTLTGTRGNTQVPLSWLAPVSSGGAAVQYKVYYRPAGGIYQLHGITSNLSYIVAGLLNGAVYYFKVTSNNRDGDGPDSNEIAVIPASVPARVTGVATSSTAQIIFITWDAPNSGGNPLIKYLVYRGSTPGAPVLVDEVDAAAREYIDNEVFDVATYYYSVRAVNDVGEGQMSLEVAGALLVPSTALAGLLSALVDAVRIENVAYWSTGAYPTKRYDAPFIAQALIFDQGILRREAGGQEVALHGHGFVDPSADVREGARMTLPDSHSVTVLKVEQIRQDGDLVMKVVVW